MNIASNVILSLIIPVGFFLGSNEKDEPASSAYITMDQAVVKWTFSWVLDQPNHSISKVSATSSMVPVMDSSSLLLLEEFNGEMPNLDDMCVYDHDPSLPSVVHRVVKIDLERKMVIFEGDNNPSSDGWVYISQIRWRVAGIVYTKRIQ